jgi:hypothetical protein
MRRVFQREKPRTFACRTSRVSPFRMMVNVPVLGNSYFGDFGKLDGVISETFAGGFLLELEMPGSMRAKFAKKLTGLEAKHRNPHGIPDVRRNARIVPAIPHSTLILADGSTRNCFVIDMSASGVAISADVQPPIGMPLGTVAAQIVSAYGTDLWSPDDAWLLSVMRTPLALPPSSYGKERPYGHPAEAYPARKDIPRAAH